MLRNPTIGVVTVGLLCVWTSTAMAAGGTCYSWATGVQQSQGTPVHYCWDDSDKVCHGKGQTCLLSTPKGHHDVTATKTGKLKNDCKDSAKEATLYCGPPKASAPMMRDHTAAGGFYRQADRTEVMYQYTSSLFCHVQNEAQMAAYGGFSKVQVVPRLQMAGQQTGGCGWPNRFYRRSNEPKVYRLSGPGFGSDICHVVNEQQMAAFGGFGKVTVVPPSSDLGRGRGAVTECKNP